MNSRLLVRALLAPAAVAASFALAGCDSDSLSLATSAKATKPLPEKLVAEMDQKNMDKQSPMLVRLFKQEAELEVWKQDRTGHYELLKTYPICRWSGDLGPKTVEGDRQAPEGFYSITPAQMNPQSAYYLSFNIGYPNAYDRALGHSGSQLMVHGDCSSRGCYAMSDEQISEIYSLGREAFFGGQRAFQVQAYPFHMTPQNLARHRNSPNMPFWKMLKEGNDHFEVTHLEPKVDVCAKHYVFDAQSPGNPSRPLNFSPSGPCPAYQIPDEMAGLVQEKQREDELKTAELVTSGTPVARLNTGVDGGMHAVFAAHVPNGQTGLSDSPPGMTLTAFSAPPAPGTIPPYVNPPRSPEPTFAESLLGTATIPAAPAAAPATAPATRVATAPEPENTSSSGGFFSNLAKKVGIGSSETAAAPPAATPASAPKPKMPIAAKLKTMFAGKQSPKSSVANAQAQVPPKGAAPQGSVQANADAATAVPAAPAAPGPTIAGAQQTVPSSSFESRFSSH